MNPLDAAISHLERILAENTTIKTHTRLSLEICVKAAKAHRQHVKEETDRKARCEKLIWRNPFGGNP